MDGSVMWAILDFFSVIVVWSDDFIFEVAGLFDMHSKCVGSACVNATDFQGFACSFLLHYRLFAIEIGPLQTFRFIACVIYSMQVF